MRGMGWQEISRKHKGLEDARAASSWSVEIRIASHCMKGICRDQKGVRRLVTGQDRRVSTTPVVVSLQGLLVGAGGAYRLAAAVEMALQWITLLACVHCRVNQAKVKLDGH